MADVHRRSCATCVACVVVSVGLSVPSLQAVADDVVLFPVKDNTLIHHPDAEYSNGLGDGVFAGRTGFTAGEIELRALMAFDVSAIPPGSVITSASLTLYELTTVSGDQPHQLHRMLADWGEGQSFAGGGGGAPAMPGDATWNFRHFPHVPWVNAGGDFIGQMSAMQLCGLAGVDYIWTSAQLAADVQLWVDNPCANFGWIMIGNEASPYSAKKFASRQYVIDPNVRPRLSVSFVPAPVCPGDVNLNQLVNIDDLVQVITSWGGCSMACHCPADLDHNGSVNIDDLVAVITNWGACK